MARFDGFQSILCYWEYERAKEKEVSDASVPKNVKLGARHTYFKGMIYLVSMNHYAVIITLL